MRIFYGEASEGLVAENVKIGDPLSLVISIDEQVGGMMTYSDYFLIILVQLMNLLKAMVSFRILVVSSTLKDKNVQQITPQYLFLKSTLEENEIHNMNHFM